MHSKIYLAIIVLSKCISISSQQSSQDELCPNLVTVFCVKDTFDEIVKTSKEIDQFARIIEQLVSQLEPIDATFIRLINTRIEDIRPSIPSKTHYAFKTSHEYNNINRTQLINLINEQYFAYMYLYNSIRNILKIQYTFDSRIKKVFAKIQLLIQHNIICNYRNILHVYSENWLTINQIDGIRLLSTRKRAAPSLLYHSYSIIIVRLLQEWSIRISGIVENLEVKQF